MNVAQQLRPSVFGSLPIIAAFLFAIAHTMPPLYYSNQNQYFLHGLGQAGYGNLENDWLVQTADPTPAFSFGVQHLYTLWGELPFHVIFFAMLLVYFLSLWAIVTALSLGPKSKSGQMAWCAAMILIHSAIIRVASVHFLGKDYPWFFQTGIANQYILGAGLQPSVFGVFILTGIAAFLRDRPILGAGLVAVACPLHSTYLLPSGMVVIGMLTSLLWSKRIGIAAIAGTLALVIAAIPIIYTMRTFAPTTPEMFLESQEIIFWKRIAHHTWVLRWFDWIVVVQLAWVVAAWLLVVRSKLFTIMTVSLALSIVLSLVQFSTMHATLGLMFPWRLSAVYVPLATALILAQLAQFDETRTPRRLTMFVAGLVALSCVAGAFVVEQYKMGYQNSRAETGVMSYIRDHYDADNLYLLPTKFLNPNSGKGAAASTFVPAKDSDTASIFELMRFRLETGARPYVDAKSIPYKDTEVMEWHRRVEQCIKWYKKKKGEKLNWDKKGYMKEIEAEGITHVLTPANIPIQSKRLKEVYKDASYILYEIEPETKSVLVK